MPSGTVLYYTRTVYRYAVAAATRNCAYLRISQFSFNRFQILSEMSQQTRIIYTTTRIHIHLHTHHGRHTISTRLVLLLVLLLLLGLSLFLIYSRVRVHCSKIVQKQRHGQISAILTLKINSHSLAQPIDTDIGRTIVFRPTIQS